MDYQEKFDLVIQSIVVEQDKKAEGVHRQFVLLTPNEKNQLSELEGHELEEILKKLQDEEKVLTYGPRDLSNFETKDIAFFDPISIEINLLETFDNWYAAYVYKKDRTLADLSSLQLEALYDIVLNISEKFETNPSPNINLPPSLLQRLPLLQEMCLTKQEESNLQAEALSYLASKGIILDFKLTEEPFLADENTEIALQIDVEKFLNFKREIQNVYENRNSIKNDETDTEKEKDARLQKKDDLRSLYAGFKQGPARRRLQLFRNTKRAS